jgi:hypothetical protein
MFSAYRRPPPLCPECRNPVRFSRGRCRKCGAAIHIPVAYFRMLWLLVLVTLAAVGIAAYSHEHPGAWLLALLCLALPLRLVFEVLVPPWFEIGPGKGRLPFIFWYISCCLFAFLYWQAWGWLHILLGASKEELGAAMAFFSMPLCWVNPRFFISTDRSFLDVCGILFGNPFFGAILTFLLYRGVHRRMQRNRITQMNIGGGSSLDEE